MIPLTAVMVGVALILALVAYSVADRDNVLHLNFITCTCAGIMTALIGAAFDAGIIYDTVGGAEHIISSPLVGAGFYSGSMIIFGIDILLIYMFLSDLISENDNRKAQNERNGRYGDDEPTFGIPHNIIIVGVGMIIGILGILTNFMFIAITNEAGGVGEAATVQTFMGIHPWIFIITLLLVIGSIVAGLKTSRRLVGEYQ